MLRRLYDRMLELAGRPAAPLWLATVAFIDGAFFTVPPELMQLPMSIARPRHALRYAALGTIASAAGAVIAYYIGAFLFERVGVPILEVTGRTAEFEEFGRAVAGNALLWPLAFLVAPMPAAIAAGSVHLGLLGALTASVIGRGGRFLVVALLLKYYGRAAQGYIERHFHSVAIAVAGLLAVFVVVRYAL
ncbi:DedA family protein [Sphingosinicellaceae bacterium]|nr:DedA family protein [Sphingosinicellaceae bacterium]